MHTYVGPYGRVQQQRQYAWLFDFQGQSISARNLHYSIRNHALFVRNGCEPSKLRSQTQQHILLVNAARPKKKKQNYSLQLNYREYTKALNHRSADVVRSSVGQSDFCEEHDRIDFK